MKTENHKRENWKETKLKNGRKRKILLLKGKHLNKTVKQKRKFKKQNRAETKQQAEKTTGEKTTGEKTTREKPKKHFI